MGKKSKAAKRAEKKEKAHLFHLQQQAAKLPGGSLLNDRVAINEKIKELAEKQQERFILIFNDYNLKQCQLERLDRTKANGLINRFKKVTATGPTTLASSGIIRDSIYNSGEYAGLFDSLPPDAEIQETEIPGGGRMFFHIVDKFFCVIAVWAQHANQH